MQSDPEVPMLHWGRRLGSPFGVIVDPLPWLRVTISLTSALIAHCLEPIVQCAPRTWLRSRQIWWLRIGLTRSTTRYASIIETSRQQVEQSDKLEVVAQVALKAASCQA